MKRFLVVLAAVLMMSSSVISAAELHCNGAPNIEEFRYTWRLRGGLRWIAGLVFPTSGVASLKSVYPMEADQTIDSELHITTPQERNDAYFSYESEMDGSGRKTLMTYNGYAWGSKMRRERTVFDYANRFARVRKETPSGVENKVKRIDDEQLRDVLTVIYFLRQNASSIKSPITTSIYEGREYPVVFQPIRTTRPPQFMLEGKAIKTVGFEIIDAPGGKKWPGHVKVWLSEDERRIPFRIEIQQSMASLQLDLSSIDGCAFMRADAAR
jgi:hypothetical protein